MTLNELFLSSYTWADTHALPLFAASLLLPMAGTALAWIGKGGRTDRDGRFVASAVMGIAFVAVLVEAAAIFAARSALGARLLDANVLLLLAPIVCLAGSVLGVRAVFPLSELGSVRVAADLGAFLLACAAALWLLSKFRGWGVLFLGSFTQLLAVAAIGAFFLWRLYRRAFGRAGGGDTSRVSNGPAARSLAVGAPPRSPALAIGLSAAVVAAAVGIVVFVAGLQPAAASGEARKAASPQPAAAAPHTVRVPAASDARPKTGAARYFTFVDDEGVQQIVDAREKVPARFRARAQELAP